MSLSREEAHHIATLCRIALAPEELDLMQEQLSHILEQFQVLGQVDTTEVAPTTSPVGLQTVMREDEISPCLDKEQVLANAPQREGDLFRVKVVLEE